MAYVPVDFGFIHISKSGVFCKGSRGFSLQVLTHSKKNSKNF